MHLVTSKPKLLIFVALFVLVGAFAVAQIIQDPGPVYSALEKTFYLTAQDAQWTRPGLQLTIQNVTIGADRKAQVTFRITDANGIAIDRVGGFTPGTVSTSFIIAYIPKDATQHVAYTTRVQTSPITKVSATQAGTDSGGTYASLGDGSYTYTFAKVLPADYDTTATHTVGIYATRNLTTYGLSLYVANATKDFVPNGSPVTKIRQVVTTAACNACHDPLAAHGSTGRQAVEICILCHQPQTIDPDTGNTVDMKVMTHKIHMGANLPSVKAGKPYQIIGNAQSVQDYSTVVFPMDIRNCENCHKNSAQVNNWWANPTAVTCGSCHDDINFQTGLNHEGGPQPSDKYCTYCHWEKSDWEFDSTIRGAHTVPYKSTQLRYPKIQIVSVSNLGPGLKPVVKFKLSDKNGPIKPTDLARLTLRFAGPTDDYRWNGSETANTAAAVVGSDGVITYSFATVALPADAKGTFALETEGYFSATLNPSTVKALAQRDVMDSAVQFFAVTGTTVTPRRTIVDDAKCDKCHDKLWFHGGNRNNAQVCSLCHNPTLTDSRPASKGPQESLDLKIMIHKIHSGENLSKDYSILGSTGTGTSFNDVLYPGDRRDCLQCHVTGSYTTPLPSTATPVTWPANAWSPVLPTAAACLGCHDTVDAASHAFVNTAAFGEACAVCHKEAADAAVSKVHAR
jgi:OmcA/MtrC family decaheme c-type cytochrome